MSRNHVPGIAIGVLHNGDEDTATYGVTNLENPLPVDADTLFQIGSITKTMTATIVMRLVERGSLDLDAPIRRYLPEFRVRDEDAAKRATLRHLVTHTGAWLGDWFASEMAAGRASRDACQRGRSSSCAPGWPPRTTTVASVSPGFSARWAGCVSRCTVAGRWASSPCLSSRPTRGSLWESRRTRAGAASCTRRS